MSVYWRGRNKIKWLDMVPGGAITGYMPYIWGNGKVFYVDSRSWGTASDTNAGTDPNYPLATIAAALALCTSGEQDYVVCLDGYDNDAAAISVAKTALHIIGVGNSNTFSPFVWLNTTGDAVFSLQGGSAVNVEIAGFTLGADATHACITFEAGGSTELSYGHIHHCGFAASTDAAFVAQDGILVPAGREANCLLVEDCIFGDEITRDGVRILGGMTSGLIRNSFFNNCGGVGVNHTVATANASMPSVLDCKFRASHGASEGWAVTIQNASGGLIDGNHASADFATADANPYLDHTDKSQWGLNYNVITATAPATT
jgi:hypothetical protein